MLMPSTIHRLRVCLEAGRPLLERPQHTSSWSTLHMAVLWTYASSALIQLSFCWSGSPKGEGLKACSTTVCGVTWGTLGTCSTRGYKKALAMPGAKSRWVEATERACRSPTLLREEIEEEYETVLGTLVSAHRRGNVLPGGFCPLTVHQERRDGPLLSPHKP